MRTRILRGGVVLGVMMAVSLVDVGAQSMRIRPRGRRRSGNFLAVAHDTTRATIGDAHITLDYDRPLKRNRMIFGAVVQLDQVWRIGENENATLVTDQPIVIGGQEVPAGKYTLYALPSDSTWQLIVNKRTGADALVYNKAEDLFRVPMIVEKVTKPIEQLELVVPDDHKMHVRWDAVDASVSVGTK